jgi:hypothetical protein
VTSQFAITTTAISACTQISMLWESLSPWVPGGEWFSDMEGSCEYIEQAVMDRW